MGHDGLGYAMMRACYGFEEHNLTLYTTILALGWDLRGAKRRLKHETNEAIT